MTAKLNLGRAIFLLLSVSILVTNCKDMKLDIQDSKDRLNVLEGTTITTINEQITAINTSISDLKEMDTALDGYIKSLETTSEALQKQIDDANAEITKVETELGKDISALEQSLLNELNTAKESIEAELTAINATLGELKVADTALDKKIETLRTYVDEQLSSTTDWANATFSTLTQYAETQTEIAAVKASIEQTNASLGAFETRFKGKIADDIKTAVDALRSELNTDYISKIDNAVTSVTTAYSSAISSAKEELTFAYNAAISIAITESETGMKSWVNEQLAQGYYDIATMDGVLSALSTRLDKTDGDLLSQINDQKTALQQAKVELTNAYNASINAAIAENNGLIDRKISDSLQDAMNNVDTKLLQINSKVESIENELQEIKDKLDKLTGEFSIIFEDYDIGVTPGSSASVAYTITGATDKTTVKALGQNGWRAQVIRSGIDKGRIKVTAPDPLTEDEIIVLAYDGEYRTIMSSINFVTGVITPSEIAYELSAEEGVIDVEISTNYNYNIRIPDNAQSWLSIVNTKSIRTDFVTFAYSANNGILRRASVFLEDEDGNDISQICFIQKEGATPIDLSEEKTANSYIVSKSGAYKFKPTKGNSDESIGSIADIEILWETFGTDVTPNVGDLIKSALYIDDCIAFQTADAFKEGNAVIAAKDADGNILWSWHIWLTDQPQGQVYYNNTNVIMDRNLGATSAIPGEVGALGLLYQWGRKDPFLGSSSISTGIVAESTITWPTTVESNSSTGKISYAIANPTTFIIRNEKNYDWYYSGGDNTDDTRWTTSYSSKSIYDPCPAGWRIPDCEKYGVWAKALGTNTYISSGTYDDTNKGMNFSGLFGAASTIWYPAAGYRTSTDSNIVYVGDTGSYWSATSRNSSAYTMRFWTDGLITPSNSNNNRSMAHSVRCIHE